MPASLNPSSELLGRGRRVGVFIPPDERKMARQNSDNTLKAVPEENKEESQSPESKKESVESQIKNHQRTTKEGIRRVSKQKSENNIKIQTEQRKHSRKSTKEQVKKHKSTSCLVRQCDGHKSERNDKKQSCTNNSGFKSEATKLNETCKATLTKERKYVKEDTKKHVGFDTSATTSNHRTPNRNKKSLEVNIVKMNIDKLQPEINVQPITPSKYKIWTRSLNSLSLNLREVLG